MGKILNMFKRHSSVSSKKGSLIINLIKDPDSFTYNLKVENGKIILTIFKDED